MMPSSPQPSPNGVPTGPRDRARRTVAPDPRTTPAEVSIIDRGDVASFVTIYDRYSPVVMALALRITRDRAAAEDVVQETFLCVWRNGARFDQARGTFKNWLVSIEHHRAIDVTRVRRGVEMSIDVPDSSVAALCAPQDVWLEVAARIDQGVVRRYIAALPDAQRECLELAYFAGLTQTQIAERTRAPIGTVKSRVRLGLHRMRQLIENGDAVQEVLHAPDFAAARGRSRRCDRPAPPPGATT